MKFNVNIVGVTFDDFGKVYNFFNVIDGLEEGDYVVCDTARGMAIGTVINLEGHSGKATKFIVDKVDMTTFNAIQDAIEKRKEIERKLDEKLERFSQINKYAFLAQSDEEAGELLEQLKSIEL